MTSTLHRRIPYALAFALLGAGWPAARAAAAEATVGAAPRLLSPSGSFREPALAARCPTFSWALVPGAPGYELVVFRVAGGTQGGETAPGAAMAADQVEPDEVALRLELPAGASSWTPDLRSCLRAGQRFAWSLRVIAPASTGRAAGTSGAHEWAEPAWLEVAATPSQEDPNLAFVKRRSGGRAEPPAAASSVAGGAAISSPASRPAPGGITRSASRASAPTLGPASLGLDRQLHLANQSAVFKNDQLFLWDEVIDDHGTTALGRGALQSNVSTTGQLGGTSNTGLGYRALRDNTSGARNTATGAEALRSNTIGANNTATGGYAMRSNTSGQNNTATGYLALFYNGTASFNTATGASSMRLNTTGEYNTATGFAALHDNSSGDWNTAQGTNALRTNTTGHRNTAVGGYALYSNTTGMYNSATGYLALVYNTTGSANTATGTGALVNNTTGTHNTATGLDALHDSETTSYNTATGALALRANTTGDHNSAHGALALRNNDIGHHNVAAGHSALLDNTSGSRNTALGAGAMSGNAAGNDNTAVGFAALGSTTGSSNVAIGSGALPNNAGSFNIGIGDDAGSAANGSHNILFNSFGVAGESNTLRIGADTGTGVRDLSKTFIQGIDGIPVTGAAVFVSTSGQLGISVSSRRFKEDIRDLDPTAIERLLLLRPVSFRYKREAVSADSSEESPLELGLIAEEVAEIYPELAVYDQEGKPFSVRYHLLPALLLEQVQAQQRSITELARALEATRTELAALRRSTVELLRPAGAGLGEPSPPAP